MKKHIAPNWAAMIGQIKDTGLTEKQIGDACHFQLTRQMLRHYERGVQPLYIRGEALMVLWMHATGKVRADAPVHEVVLPYRVPQGARPPRVEVNLPDWPPAVQRVEMQGKKRGRPSKLSRLVGVKETA